MLETCDIRFPLVLLSQNDTILNNLLHHADLFIFFVICSCNDNCWSGFVDELALSWIIYEHKYSKIFSNIYFNFNFWSIYQKYNNSYQNTNKYYLSYLLFYIKVYTTQNFLSPSWKGLLKLYNNQDRR